jgi:hypothetical protein
MTLTAKVFTRIEVTQAEGDASWTPIHQKALTLAEGTGVGQFDLVYAAEHTIASASNLDLDLAGALEDGLGGAVVFAELVALQIINEAEDGTVNTTAITVGGGSNPFDGFWGTAGDQIVLNPSDMFLIAGRGAAGIGAVTADTADILRIANASGAAAKVQVMILGRSA